MVPLGVILVPGVLCGSWRGVNVVYGEVCGVGRRVSWRFLRGVRVSWGVCGSRGGIFMVPGEVSHWFLVRYHCSF